ncbi:hypothetical protein HYPSUDRAFT_34513 [Hypholoma sublateritium FD-334 SS-4]|uniref:Uncharacterized protein n=1 Tax=Hypholoma sublateritium (strain FD-334 SS-4) TaxID=945553 RepID=A0A0D2PI57_HYPSF|nr:hypothetical protein HYPSUDRAFT_34513 [Hypholoma sublateritium FD-334 SS-4]
MASKGSTSWENSLKSRPNMIQEDIVPAGWKILDTTKEDPVVGDDGKKKPNGGLLSFFGRRGTNSSTDTAKRSSSPIASISSVKSGSSPRVSVEGGRRSASQSVAGDKSTPSSPSVASFGTNVAQKNDAGSLSETQANSTTAPVNEIAREPSPPPPSAVSRFLGRFSSRPKTSSMDSIALSQDDLEFLSDVPSLTSPEVDHGMGFDALSSMIKSPPLPTTLPAPLAPPPKAPPKTAISSPAPGLQSQNDDFMAFFDGLDRQPQAPIQPDSPLPLLAAVPTPPVKPVASSYSHSPSPPAAASLSIPTVRVGSPDQQPDQSWSSFDYPSAPMNKPLPPPSKRAFVPIMSSSSRPSSTAPPLLPGPGSITPLSPPPTGRRGSGNVDHLSGTSAGIAPLPPPPTSRSHTPLRSAQPTPPVSQPVSIDDDDDDFADFLSSPAAQTTQSGLLSFSDFTPAPSQTQPPLLNGKSAVSTTVSEFDHFLGPLPPQPPVKSNSFASNTASSSSSISSAKIPGTLSNIGLTRKISRKADHSRTLSLMETAAARGRWLNPPSPLPEALQPPPNARIGSNMDLFDSGGSSMQTQQANVMASFATSHSTPAMSSNASTETVWNFPPPMKAVPMPPAPRPQASLPGAAQPPATLQPSPMQNGNVSAASNGSKAGGLSAQDLSFFEGL